MAYNDKNLWLHMTSKRFDTFEFSDPVTLFFVFASSEFPLFKGRTERISMGMLHAYEKLSDISSNNHLLYLYKDSVKQTGCWFNC